MKHLTRVIEFLSKEDGSPDPSVTLLEIAGSAVTVSISHEKEYAIAVVILF
jgi:phosphopantetheinyl transferase (holo-ACP synthase)